MITNIMIDGKDGSVFLLLSLFFGPASASFSNPLGSTGIS